MIYTFKRYKNVSVDAGIIMLDGLENASCSVGWLNDNETIEQALNRLKIDFDTVYPDYEVRQELRNTETGSNTPYGSHKTNPIQIYVDGSDIKGTGNMGYGAYTKWQDKEYKLSGTEQSDAVKQLNQLFPQAKFSNPTMEMLGLVETLKQFANTAEHIVINQDYKGAVNYNGLWLKSEGSLQREPKAWKAKEPYIEYLVKQAEALIAQIEANGGSVTLNWVKGHQTGTSVHKHGNDNADALAKDHNIHNSFLTKDQSPSF